MFQCCLCSLLSTLAAPLHGFLNGYRLGKIFCYDGSCESDRMHIIAQHHGCRHSNLCGSLMPFFRVTGLTPGDQPIPLEFHLIRGLFQAFLFFWCGYVLYVCAGGWLGGSVFFDTWG